MPSDKDLLSHSAFSTVDALASKTILGNDGAASWQEFRQSEKSGPASRGTAPHKPLKRADKLGTGFRSINEERQHEEQMRSETNDAKMNSGYTHFKRKHETRAEIDQRKRCKMIQERVRPEKVKYFIAAATGTFEGWKEDYIFTTRDRGIGYYWDGMDSLNKLKGGNDGGSELPTNETASSKEEANTDTKQKKKKKKKKKDKKNSTQSSSHAIEEDRNNPIQQVLNAMRRRTEILSRPPGSVSSQILMENKAALTGTISSSNTAAQNNFQTINTNDNENLTIKLAKYNWEVATDPTSGKLYYFSRKTGERQWDNPLKKLKSAANTATSTSSPSSDEKLPDGWRPAKDAVGRTYYYHRESGKTSWDKPTSNTLK